MWFLFIILFLIFILVMMVNLCQSLLSKCRHIFFEKEKEIDELSVCFVYKMFFFFGEILKLHAKYGLYCCGVPKKSLFFFYSLDLSSKQYGTDICNARKWWTLSHCGVVTVTGLKSIEEMNVWQPIWWVLLVSTHSLCATAVWIFNGYFSQTEFLFFFISFKFMSTVWQVVR